MPSSNKGKSRRGSNSARWRQPSTASSEVADSGRRPRWLGRGAQQLPQPPRRRPAQEFLQASVVQRRVGWNRGIGGSRHRSSQAKAKARREKNSSKARPVAGDLLVQIRRRSVQAQADRESRLGPFVVLAQTAATSGASRFRNTRAAAPAGWRGASAIKDVTAKRANQGGAELSPAAKQTSEPGLLQLFSQCSRQRARCCRPIGRNRGPLSVSAGAKLPPSAAASPPSMVASRRQSAERLAPIRTPPVSLQLRQHPLPGPPGWIRW